MHIRNRNDKINILFKTSEVIVINRNVVNDYTLEKTSKNKPRTNACNAIHVWMLEQPVSNV